MRIGVAGLGFMGCTHARAWPKVPGAELAAVVSSDPAKLSGDISAVGGNLGGSTEKLDFSAVKKYYKFEDLLEDAEIDAVDICLPSDRHFETARAALRAGKHVLVEKPLALNGEDADALIEEAARAGRTLMTGHVLRFFPEYRTLADLLREGRLGAVRSAFFRRRCGAPSWSRWLTDAARSGGAVMDLLIHDIDVCLHVFGQPETVSAVGFGDPARGIDWIEARLGFTGIGPVIVTGGWHQPGTYPFRMEFTVAGDAGTLEYRSGDVPLTLYNANGASEPAAVETDPFAKELKYFADCARDSREPVLCPPRESAMAVRLAALLVEARKRNGEEMTCRF